MREFVVRLAAEGDVEAVVALEMSVEEAPHWGAGEYEAIVKAGSEGALRRCLWVAEGEDGVIGFAVGKILVVGEEVEAELESVAVDGRARRGGVGRALCEAVMEWCRGQGAGSVELEVRSANAAAIGLYRSMGFVETGRRKGYYRDPVDDAVLMRGGHSS